MTKTDLQRRVFVTGGAGFIGRELARKLLDSGYYVVCFDVGEQFERHKRFFDQLENQERLTMVRGTIMDRVALQTSMIGADVVFHLAAMLGVQRTEENKLKCLDTNIGGTDNVLNACVFSNVKHIVFASSSEVYGEPMQNPIKESDITQGKTVYAVSKLAGEEIVKGYHQIFPQIDYTIVRFFNTYGEGQVAQFVISRFVHAVMNGQAPVVYGDGKQKRSYCHVNDTTDGLLAVIENPIAFGKTYNLGNSRQMLTLEELARKVIDTVAPDRDLDIEVLGHFDGSDRSPEREIYIRYCDSTRAESELGFSPKITVEEGIRRIAQAEEIYENWPNG